MTTENSEEKSGTPSVLAKFVCIFAEDKQGAIMDEDDKPTTGLYRRFIFNVVYGSSPENKKFFASTPSGHITIDCVRQSVNFEVGREYYIAFTPALVAETEAIGND
jgi:hypothetical protein